MIDTLREVTTPELIEIKLHPAGLLARTLAWIIDALIRLGLFFLATLIFTLMGKTGIGLLLVYLFLQEWFYFVLFEVLNNGQTLGKKTLGLVVLHDDGTPVGWGASFTRNLLRAVDFMPFLYLAGILSILFHKEFRRLGDIVAHTVVCYREPLSALPAIPVAPVIIPDEPLDRDNQRAIISFAERSPSLTAERQRELARLVPYLSSSKDGASPSGPTRLLGLANYIVGRHQ